MQFNLKTKFILFTILAIAGQLFNFGQYRNSHEKVQQRLDIIVKTHGNSIHLLNQLSAVLYNTETIVFNRLYFITESSYDANRNFNNIYHTKLSKIEQELQLYSNNWSESEKQLLQQIMLSVKNDLLPLEQSLINSLERSNISDTNVRGMKTTTKKLSHKINVLIDSLRHTNEFLMKQSDEISKNAETNLLYSTIALIAICLLVLIAIFGWFIMPLQKLSAVLNDMSLGTLNLKNFNAKEAEIKTVYQSLEKLVGKLQAATAFSKKLSNSEYESDFSPASDSDELGNALIELRNNLQTATQEAEERRQKDLIQNWTTQGLAKFGEILRQNEDNINKLGQTIISNLVKYMNINQGGIFVQNVDEYGKETLDLVAMYAYDREKFASKQIMPGEGLVGTCYVEKVTVYMTEVPQSYVHISSGLGEATPSSILLVPLKKEEGVLGVIELGSFSRLEKHEIAFVEKIAESIASTLSNVRINEQTSGLLARLQEQTEAMKSQEEEMRQNLEEMQATQEEAERREEELNNELENVRHELNMMRQKMLNNEDA